MTPAERSERLVDILVDYIELREAQLAASVAALQEIEHMAAAVTAKAAALDLSGGEP